MSTDILPEGKYLARAKQWAFTEASTGTPQVYIYFELEDGGSISHFLAMSPKAFEYSMKALTTLGYSGTDVVNDLERADAGLDKNQVELVVEHEEYEGKVRARVKWINSLGGGFKPLDAGKKASFAQEMRARALAFRQTQPTQTGPKQPDGPPPGHPASDDIPF
jgi:hypothetical protein